jgi:hypothetical protein
MRPYSRRFADTYLIALLVCALAVPAHARRGPAVAASKAPTVDKSLTRKQQVEMLKGKLEQAQQQVRACAASAPAGEARTALEAEAGPLEAMLKDAAWAYHVGNYEEALRRYAGVEKRLKPSQLTCDKLRAGADKCAKSVQAALERIRGWSLKIARIQDPTSRAQVEEVYKKTEVDLASIEKTCATTDPAWVGKQIPVILKPLDDAIKTAK